MANYDPSGTFQSFIGTNCPGVYLDTDLGSGVEVIGPIYRDKLSGLVAGHPFSKLQSGVKTCQFCIKPAHFMGFTLRHKVFRIFVLTIPEMHPFYIIGRVNGNLPPALFPNHFRI
jgi:hypothetical protein